MCISVLYVFLSAAAWFVLTQSYVHTELCTETELCTHLITQGREAA